MLTKKRLAWCILYILQGWIPVTTPVLKRRLLKIFLLPFAFILSVVFILEGKVILPRVELVITTKCNLNCKDCANLVPAYNNPENFQLSELRKAMDTISSVVDGIGELKIMGGGTFSAPRAWGYT